MRAVIASSLAASSIEKDNNMVNRKMNVWQKNEATIAARNLLALSCHKSSTQ